MSAVIVAIDNQAGSHQDFDQTEVPPDVLAETMANLDDAAARSAAVPPGVIQRAQRLTCVVTDLFAMVIEPSLQPPTGQMSVPAAKTYAHSAKPLQSPRRTTP